MFGAHTFGQGYFGKGPNEGDAPPTVLFRAAYRLWLRLIGHRRTLQAAAGRRSLRGASGRRSLGTALV